MSQQLIRRTCSIAALSVIIFAAGGLHSAQADTPYSIENIINLQKEGLSEEELIARVKMAGISFAPDSTSVNQLRDGGLSLYAATTITRQAPVRFDTSSPLKSANTTHSSTSNSEPVPSSSDIADQLQTLVVKSGFQSLEGKAIAVTTQPPDKFVAMTAGKASFGLFGALATIGSGESIVKNNSIEDPAGYIGQQLVAFFNANFSTIPTGPILINAPKSLEKLANELPNVDILIDVKTTGWGFAYYPTHWSNYGVIYNAKIRLINNKTQQVIAEGALNKRWDEAPTSAPTKDALLANNASMLKAELRKKADICVREMLDRLIKTASFAKVK